MEVLQKQGNIIIYRNFLLQYSETFIKEQAESLNFFVPYYVGTKLVDNLKLDHGRCFVVNRGRFFDRFQELYSQSLNFGSTFLNQIKNINPQLIHAHFAQDAVTALPLAKAFDIPLVVTCHGYDVTVEDKYAPFSLIQKKYQLNREKLKNSVSLFIAVSEFIKQKIIAQGFPEDRVIVHYTGVNLNRFYPPQKPDRKPMILFVGRLVEKKGCEYLVRSMCHIQSLIPEVELVVIGDGKLRASLEKFAERHLRKYRFLGTQSQEIVQYWMQRAMVFCVPSITAHTGDSEGFGMVFAEAQASGLPVVSFASGGISEAVAHNVTGFLAPERDIDALTIYLLRLLQDQKLWQDFSFRGQERVKKLFDLHSQTQKLEKIYIEQSNRIFI